jgi:hypothetical protein
MDGEYIPPPETVEAFENSLDAADTVAVAAPWSGRDALLDRAGERERVTERVSPNGTDEPLDGPDPRSSLVPSATSSGRT